MNRKGYRDYTMKHEKIVNKLMEMSAEGESGCFSISRLAIELGMDQRTVKAHLKIIEMDHGGIFTDPDEKQFCTKEGVILLAQRLGLGEIAERSRNKKLPLTSFMAIVTAFSSICYY